MSTTRTVALDFRPGDRVRVYAGRFTGQRGEIVYVGQRLTVKLIDGMGYLWRPGASVRVGRDAVRREGK